MEMGCIWGGGTQCQDLDRVQCCDMNNVQVGARGHNQDEARVMKPCIT